MPVSFFTICKIPGVENGWYEDHVAWIRLNDDADDTTMYVVLDTLGMPWDTPYVEFIWHGRHVQRFKDDGWQGISQLY